jgi:hypothetical protein
MSGLVALAKYMIDSADCTHRREQANERRQSSAYFYSIVKAVHHAMQGVCHVISFFLVVGYQKDYTKLSTSPFNWVHWMPFERWVLCLFFLSLTSSVSSRKGWALDTPASKKTGKKDKKGEQRESHALAPGSRERVCCSWWLGFHPPLLSLSILLFSGPLTTNLPIRSFRTTEDTIVTHRRS